MPIRGGVTTFVEVYEGRIPSCCIMDYEIIGKRAHELVKNCGIEQLKRQTETLNWMLYEVNPAAFIADDENESDEKKYVSVPTRLYNARDDYSLDDPDNLTWPEYFGLLAFVEIAQASILKKFERPENLDITEARLHFSTLGHHAIYAMEAMCYGEQLARPSQIEKELEKLAEEKHKRKRSLRAKNAAIKRHAKTRELRLEFTNYYFSGSFPSKREAARRFLKTLPNDKRRLLAESNALRTLTGWIAGYKKPSDA